MKCLGREIGMSEAKMLHCHATLYRIKTGENLSEIKNKKKTKDTYQPTAPSVSLLALALSVSASISSRASL